MRTAETSRKRTSPCVHHWRKVREHGLTPRISGNGHSSEGPCFQQGLPVAVDGTGHLGS